MIQEMNVLMGPGGYCVLVVSGSLPDEDLVLSVSTGRLSLFLGNEMLADVTSARPDLCDYIASFNEIGILATPDPDRPPLEITHIARVEYRPGDRRISA